VNSINTNPAALLGAQAFTAASNELTATQRRLATGLKVASAKDNGATWSIANARLRIP
jgi:flagellin